MNSNKKLEELRKRIDEIDAELVKYFIERLNVSLEISKVKSSLGIQTTNEERENQVIKNAKNNSNNLFDYEIEFFIRNLIFISKYVQNNY